MNCVTCGHREDDHDHLSGLTFRRDCEFPDCACENMVYEDNSDKNEEQDRLVPDVDPKKKLENAYLLTLPPVTKPLVLWDGAFYDWWIRNLQPRKNVVIMNISRDV